MTDADPHNPTVAAIVRQQAGVSWSKARRLCTDGRVTVDGMIVLDPASRVVPGSVVAIDPHAAKVLDSPISNDAIVHCDSDVVVVDKPAGLLSVADDEGNRDTVADHTRTLLRRSRRHGPDTALGIVHRLDRDTSGLMMFTRSATAKRLVAAQFRAHTIERTYVAIAHGRVEAAKIDTSLMADRGDGLRGSIDWRNAHGVRAGGEVKRAVTHVEPIAVLDGATLVECRLETGRQHQIRIHLAEAGHPLIGERVYIRDHRGPRIAAPRAMLHARTLGFTHPRTGRMLRFEREPPDDFRAMLEHLAIRG